MLGGMVVHREFEAAFEGLVDFFEQQVIGKRLGQHTQSTRLIGHALPPFISHAPDEIDCGHEDDRNVDSSRSQKRLKFKAVHALQMHVENKAIW